MTKTALLFVTILLVVCFGLMAADISGKWVAEMPGRNGGPARQTTFNLKADGGKLSGTVSSPGRNGSMDSEIKDGKVEGNTVSFKVVREMGGNSMTMEYTGTMDGDTLNLKMTMNGGPNGPMTRDVTAKRSTT